jgi:Tfp pilus assembly protein PilF
MTEQLDLAKHAPHEFEGKTILWNGVEYVIGAYVSSGFSVIVHRLVNRRSRLCHHVIKVWRDIDQAREVDERKIDRVLVLNDLTPMTLKFMTAGGAYDIQKYLGPYADPTDEATNLTCRGDTAAKAGNTAEALALYDSALQMNPEHTEALCNRANTYYNMGDAGKALSSAFSFMAIEPHDEVFLNIFLRLALATGRLSAARRYFTETVRKIPVTKECYDLGMEACLASGDPDGARSILEQRRAIGAVDSDAKMAETIERELMRKKEARLIMGGTRWNAANRTGDDSSMLQRAFEVYEADPVIRMNLAFDFRRRGKNEEALELLYRTSLACAPVHVGLCLANAGLCAVRAGKFAQAEAIFDRLYHNLTVSGEVALADIPNEGIWVMDDSQVESTSESVRSAIEVLIADERKTNGKAPSFMLELGTLYRRWSDEVRR